MDEQQKELARIADDLSLLFKHGAIPARHTYARKVVGGAISQLRQLANKNSKASWSASACNQGIWGCVMDHEEVKDA